MKIVFLRVKFILRLYWDVEQYFTEDWAPTTAIRNLQYIFFDVHINTMESLLFSLMNTSIASKIIK